MATFVHAAVSCLTVLVLLTGSARAQIVNGSFDLPGGSQPGQAVLENSGYITGWLTVPGTDGTFTGAVEYYHDRSQDPGGYCVELGTYNGTTGLEQLLTTLPNEGYQVAFWLASDPYNGTAPGRLRVSAGGSSSDFTPPPRTGDGTAAGWVPQTFAFTSDGSGQTTLLFQNYPGAPSSASPPMIDTVSITAVPEVSSMVLAAVGGVGVGWRTRRRRRRG